MQIAQPSGDTAFVLLGGAVEVSTGYVLVYEHYTFEVASPAGVLVETDLTFPEDARLQSGHVSVAAQAAGLATIASVASVRPAAALVAGSAGSTVDFGRLVTVGGISTSSGVMTSFGLPSIDRVSRWTGATWSFLSTSGSFPETVTDRLLVESADDIDDAELAERLIASGSVRIPVVPASLELLVNGTTVWFERQGSSPIDLAVPVVVGGVGFVIDRTEALRDAVARAPVTDGLKTVRVGLRAGTPGKLTLVPSVAALRVHTVAFPPDGLVRSVDLPEEGEVTYDVTPPAAADVREATMTVRGSFGPERIQPALGPAVLGDAHLVLAPARPVLVGLPDELTSRFGTMTGVRLVLRATATTNGGQVTGRLLADAGGRPGDPLPGGELTPVTVTAGPERYWTLSFAEEVEPPVLAPPDPSADPDAPRVSLWLELQLGHGAVECGFTNADPNDPVAPGGVVVRRLPGGGTAELTDIPSLGPLRAAVRVVGVPDRDRPIPAVVLGIDGTIDVVGVTPTTDDLATRLTLAAPLAVAGPVVLRATVAAVGTLTLDTVQVTYREAV